MSRFRDDEMVSGKLANEQDALIQALERKLAEYKTKEQKRNGASLNELMTWSVKELAELVVDLNDEHEDFERQLAEARAKLSEIESVCEKLCSENMKLKQRFLIRIQ